MPDQDVLLAQKQRAELESAAQASTDAAKLAHQLDAHKAARLRALFDNAEVQWFLEEFVDPVVQKEDDDTHDLKRTAEEANISRHRHALAVELRALLAKKTEEFEAKAAGRPKAAE